MGAMDIELVAGYTFRNRQNLTEALTAPGADKRKYDGNRRLAQLGESILRTTILDKAFASGASTGDYHQRMDEAEADCLETANLRLCTLGSRKHREVLAAHIGLSSIVTVSPRQFGKPTSPRVLSQAICALIGAAWLDCEKDFRVVSRITENLG